ncbi:hypothetical protein JCM11491_006548 [Sporobolomyces phaffii]
MVQLTAFVVVFFVVRWVMMWSKLANPTRQLAAHAFPGSEMVIDVGSSRCHWAVPRKMDDKESPMLDYLSVEESPFPILSSRVHLECRSTGNASNIELHVLSTSAIQALSIQAGPRCRPEDCDGLAVAVHIKASEEENEFGNVKQGELGRFQVKVTRLGERYDLELEGLESGRRTAREGTGSLDWSWARQERRHLETT